MGSIMGGIPIIGCDGATPLDRALGGRQDHSTSTTKTTSNEQSLGPKLCLGARHASSTGFVERKNHPTIIQHIVLIIFHNHPYVGFTTCFHVSPCLFVSPFFMGSCWKELAKRVLELL